jgi:hypothetical protein
LTSSTAIVIQTRFRAGILHVVAVILLVSQISCLILKFEAVCCKHLDLGRVFPESETCLLIFEGDGM